MPVHRQNGDLLSDKEIGRRYKEMSWNNVSAMLDAELAYEMATYGRPLNDYLDDSDDDGKEGDASSQAECQIRRE